MGRQTIWGGAGKPPSRDVMQAAAKAARSEMMDRIRTNKATQRGDKPARQDGERSERSQGQRPAPSQSRGPRNAQGGANQGPHAGQGQGQGRNRRGGSRPQGGRERDDEQFDDHRQPRADAHLGTQFGHPKPARRTQGGGQPDPMRTSVDSMGGRGNRGGGYRSGGGGNGGGFGGGRGGYR
jgi:ATP-dependent RNA helicase RhlE